MRSGIPRLDTYVAPGESLPAKPAPASQSPAALEATLADISLEMTNDAIARRNAVALAKEKPPSGH